MTHQALAELVERHLSAMQYAATTQRSRRYQLEAFTQFLEKENVRVPADITLRVFEAYIRFLSKRRLADGRTLSRTSAGQLIAGARAFTAWLCRERLMLSDPARSVERAGQVKAAPREVLTRTEALRVLACVDTETALGLRNRVLLELLYATAIRAAEVVKLQLGDVSEAVFVRSGKGGKDRLTPLGERGLFWINRYVQEARPQLVGRARHEYLFVASGGKPMHERTLHGIVRGLLNAAGITKPGASHLFRHSCATHMLEGGADVRHIQEMLGHARVSTTQIYTRVSAKHLREAVRRTHPAAFADAPQENTKPARTRALYLSRGPGRERRTWPKGRIASLCQEYLKYREEVVGSSAMTLKGLRKLLLLFADFCVERRIVREANITPELITEFAGLPRKDGGVRAVEARSNRAAAVCGLVRFLFKRGLILTNPADMVRLPRRGHKLPAAFLTREEVERVLAQPDTASVHGLRDRAILELFYATGIRRAECAGLALADLDQEAGTLRVRRGKGLRERTLPVPERTLDWLLRYIQQARDEFASISSADCEALFISGNGTFFTDERLGTLVKRYLKLAGIEKRGSAHLFRHTAPTLMLENGAGLREVQEFLGHVRTDTTQIYTHVSIRRLHEAHGRTHPAEVLFRERRQRLLEEENSLDNLE